MYSKYQKEKRLLQYGSIKKLEIILNHIRDHVPCQLYELD